MPSPITWFEIIGKDSDRLQRFYREVFGWKMTPPAKEQGNYSMLEDFRPGIGGGIGEGDARVSVYAEVADPQSYVDKAVARGATLVMPVTTITPTTTIAMLVDPSGNTFGILKAQPARATATKRTATKARATKTTKKRTTPRARKKTTRRR